jgi:branched-subunit amino acid ABC-type transport system permease component
VSLALTIGQFTPTTGNVFLVTIIAAAVVGGVGRPVGAILGALIVGVSEEIVAVPASEYQVVVGFALLILVLLLRPQGILGTAQVRSG